MEVKRKPSLRAWLIGILIICWLLPMAAVIAVSGYFISGSFRERIKDTVATSVENALSQSESRLSAAMDASRALSYDNTVRAAWEAYLADGDTVALYDDVTAYLIGKYAYDDSFRATMLFFPDGPGDVYFAYNRSYSGAASGIRHFLQNVYAKAGEISGTLGTQTSFFTLDDGFYMIRNLVDSSFDPYAVLVMECDAAVLFDSVDSIVWLSGAYVTVDGVACRSVGDETVPAQLSQGVTRLQGDRYAAKYSGLASGHRLSISAVANGDLLTEEFPRLTATVVTILAVALPMLVLAIWAFGKQVTAPVNELVDATGKVESGERGYTVDVMPGNREFMYLTERFNSMSTQLKSQFERSYQEQLALQDARMKALQSQINPHFLNNTLEAINWEARMAGDEKVSRMIEALSDLLDAATARGGSANGTIAEELRYTDSYLYIISERFGERITVRREVDESLLGTSVPRLILQPIVENAVEHGISLLPSGELTLRVYSRGGAAVLEVEHDGVMTDADREAISKLLGPDEGDAQPPSGHVGIRNVNRRLRILYGEGSGLSVGEVADGRILARIIVPIAQGRS